MDRGELYAELLRRHPGLTLAQIADLDTYQIEHVYLRPRREDGPVVNGYPGQSKTDPFEAYVKALEWQGVTPEKARQMLQERMSQLGQEKSP